jgi:NAD-dependent dihydropyrimidine dehydrogenase PreA subunit
MAFTVTVGACQGCGACVLTCPARAIRAAPGAPLVLIDRCTGCGECEEVCPVNAIAFTRQPAREGTA